MSKWSIFLRGSHTYFWSSLFFPRGVRSEVATLYAFVRVADDFVDRVPADREGFESFERSYREALRGPVGDETVDAFVSLQRQRGFAQEWVDAFFASMRMDLDGREYESMEQLLEYMYGSAEVVGLMMARIMDLDEQADESARLLGRAMQLINFVRDVDEDNGLSRAYLPSDLPDLTEETVRAHRGVFVREMRSHIRLFREWMAAGREGFSFLPRRCLIPIMTAADMYSWTAGVIEADPFVVFSRKVKPSKLRVVVRGLRNSIRL